MLGCRISARASDKMPKKNSAWSLVELVALLAALALWGAVLFPALARTGSNSQSLQCMNNLRQLMAAMLLYTHENHDLFPPNPDDGTTLPGYNWCPGDALNAGDGINLLKDSLLNIYIQNNLTLFKCPADVRFTTS